MSDKDSLKPHLERYLKSHGVKFDASGKKFICPFHNDTEPSMGIVPDSNGTQAYCFVCQSSGDIFSIAAHFYGLDNKRDFSEIKRRVTAELGQPVYDAPSPVKQQARDKPPDAPVTVSYQAAREIYTQAAISSLGRLIFGKDLAAGAELAVEKVWPCKNESGAVEFVEVRFHPSCFADGKKRSTAMWWNGRGLKAKSCPHGIYGRDLLAAFPGKPVLIVEGPKCQEVAAKTLPDFVAIAWNGGANGQKRLDFSLLKDRAVYIWPDDDEAGAKSARATAKLLQGIAGEIIIVKPLPEARTIKAEKADIVEALQVKTPPEITEYIKGHTPPVEPVKRLIPTDTLTETEKEYFAELAEKIEHDGGIERDRAEITALEIIHKERQKKHAHESNRREEIKALREKLRSENKLENEMTVEMYLKWVDKKVRGHTINCFEPTEKAQAEAAEFYLDGLVQYTAGSGWLVYNYSDGCFRPDMAEKVLSKTLQKLAQERYDLRHADDPKEYYKYAEKAVTNSGIKNVESILKKNLEMADADFNKHYYLLNCRGETYDLRTGERTQSTPEHYHTKTTGFKPQEGPCPAFFDFLSEITCGDTELASWIMRWFGYGLTGDTRAAYFVNFHGSGRNGKGTLLHVMRQIMGDYAREIDPEVIVDNRKGGNVKNALANLVGIRAGFSADVPAGSLNLTDLKRITGGDNIVAERKYCNSFEFRPVVKLTFSSNPRLRLSETGQAVRSRLRYIPFNYSAAGREDRGLENKILKEAPQILHWLIKEAGEYLKNADTCGFPPCKVIDAATEDYIKDEDILGQFLDECTEEAPYERVKAAALYNRYVEWANERRDRPISSNSFGRKMRERGIEKAQDRNGFWWKNIKIRG